MKKRSGFVSNSSTSSFTCEICGETASGWDLSKSEVGMIECVNEHLFCESHLLDVEEKEVTPQEKRDVFVCLEQGHLAHWEKSSYQRAEEYAQGNRDVIHFLRSMDDKELDNYFYDGDGWDEWESYIAERGGWSASCPLCQFHSMTDRDLADFALSELKWKKDFAKETAKLAYGTYEKFREAMRNEG